LIIALFRRVPAIEQLPLPAIIRFRLDELPFCSGNTRVRGAKSIFFVLSIEPGQLLPSLDTVTDGDEAFYDTTANPEGEINFRLGFDGAGQRERVTSLLLGNRCHAHRPHDRFGFFLSLTAASRDERRENEACNCPSAPGIKCRLSGPHQFLLGYATIQTAEWQTHPDPPPFRHRPFGEALAHETIANQFSPLFRRN
jgi:hypothetical protein